MSVVPELYEARSDVGKLQTQLSTLEEQQARLQSQYDNALDLEQIEKRAKELGMRQPGSSQIIPAMPSACVVLSFAYLLNNGVY